MTGYRIYAPEVFERLDGRLSVVKPCERCEWVDITAIDEQPTKRYIVGQPCPEHIRTMPPEFR